MDYVISLGGSCIVPDKIDIEFLKEFKALIDDRVEKGDRFIIVTGGGKTCRTYQDAAREIFSPNNDSLDWIGIKTTALNAELVRSIFNAPEVIIDPTKEIERKNIMIACGWKPGCSSDKDAVLLAQTFNIPIIMNLSNIDYLYDKDPNLDGAKPLVNASWDELKSIVGNKWVPGANFPFDPIATQLASDLKLKLIIIYGKNITNLKNFFEDNSFIGSVIQ